MTFLQAAGDRERVARDWLKEGKRSSGKSAQKM